MNNSVPDFSAIYCLQGMSTWNIVALISAAVETRSLLWDAHFSPHPLSELFALTATIYPVTCKHATIVFIQMCSHCD